MAAAQRLAAGQLVGARPQRAEALALPLGAQGVAGGQRGEVARARGVDGGAVEAVERGDGPVVGAGARAQDLVEVALPRAQEPRIEKGRSRGLSQLEVTGAVRGRVTANRGGGARVEGS